MVEEQGGVGLCFFSIFSSAFLIFSYLFKCTSTTLHLLTTDALCVILKNKYM